MKTSVWNLVTKWPRTLKWWERFKLAFRPILFISILFVSLIPSYFQQESLYRVYEGIALPNSDVSLNLNFTEPTNVYILFPYEIENKGFHDLSHISLRVALFIEYFHLTTGGQCRTEILNSKGEQGHARMGESYVGLFEKNFLEFNWESIDAYVLKMDENRAVNVYMDIELSFILSGVEEDRIIFQGINLTSSTNSDILKTNENIINRGGSVEHSLLPLISLLGIISISLMLYLQRKGILKNRTIKERGRNIIQFLSSKKKLLIGSAKNLLFTALFLTWDFLVILTQIISGVFTSEYIAWTMIVFVSTIILIGIIDWLSILPSLHPRSFWKYSFKERKRKFFSSTISLFVVILWSTTGYISYAVNSSILIIRNTIFSFFPIIFLLSLNLMIKGVDLVIASRSKVFFQKLKVEQEAKEKGGNKSISSKGEFNIDIFKAINQLNEEGKSATITQIKNCFHSRNIPFIFKKHIRINSKYLETLVGDKCYRGMSKYSWQGPFYDGEKAFEKGVFVEALTYFQAALKLNDEKAKIWYSLAFALQELKKYDEAINAYEEALKINNTRKDSAWKGLMDRAIKIQLSYVYRDLGNYQKALDTISERLKWTTHDDRIYRDIALFYKDLGQYQKAIEAAEKALEINKKGGIAFTHQGFAFMKLGELEKARKMMEKAIEIDPYFARSYYKMALYYLEVNQKETALEFCEKSLQVDRNFAESIELKERFVNK